MTQLRPLLATTTIAITMFFTAPASIAQGGWPAHKAAALSTLQPRFDALAAKYRDDALFQQFLYRIQVLDQLGQLVQARLDTATQQALGRMFAPRRGASAAAPVTVRGSEILAEYSRHFDRPLSPPSLPEAELNLLVDYYTALIASIEDYAMKRSRRAVVADEGAAADVIEVCLAIPLLHTQDAQWDRERVEKLPEWLRSPKFLPLLERFSLLAQRPLTAFAFHARLQPKADLVLYLRDAGEKLAADREYHAALRALRVGVQSADSTNATAHACDLRMRLAALLATIGHPADAAREVKAVLAANAQGLSYGKAALLRLKYLLEAELPAEAASEASAYAEDERCRPYLPQILYLGWVCYRRSDRVSDAQRVQETFLKSFPNDPLAAEMHFVTAMTALAASDFPEAMRHLEIIQYRYPTSPVTTKAKELESKLKAANLAIP